MRLLSLLLILFLSSCGTLRSPDNIVPIDSSPRGVEVNYQNKKIGVTPFFYKVDNGKTHKFSFLRGNQSIEQKYKCSPNWGQSILPSTGLMLLYPVGTFFGGIGLTADYFSGAFFKCDKTLILNADISSKKSKSKKKVIILPVMNDDEEFSKIAVEKFLKKYPKIQKKIINQEDLSYDLYERGITHFKDNNPKLIKRFFLNEIALKYGATHFYYFPYKREKNKYTFSPKLIDAFSLREVKTEAKETIVIEKKRSKDNEWTKIILKAVKIIPNGFRFSKSIDPTVSFSYRGDDHDSSQTDKHPKAMPKYASSIRIENVQHPSLYKDWDISGVIYPWLSASSWRSSDLGPNSDYSIWLSNYYVFLNGELTFHTPIGAFSAGLGYGVNFSEINDSLGNSGHKTGATYNLGLSYVAFFSRSFYFRLALENFVPEKEKLYFGTYALKGWSEGSIGIGLYFPTLKKIVGDWIGK